MKPQDIHIGDFVYNTFHKKKMRIQAYDFFTHIHHADGSMSLADNPMPTLFRDIEPIAISEEVLERNGWILTNREGRFEYNIGGQFGTTFWYYTKEHTLCANEYNAEEESYDRLIWLRHVHYIHQLQGAFRLCGHEEMADEFKIE